MKGVAIKLSHTEAAVERAALGLAEMRDRISRVESDVTGLRAAMADGSAKVDEVRREVAGLKAKLSDCYPKVNQDLANLEQEVAKLKEEIKAMKPKPEPLAPPAADFAVPPAAKAAAPAQESLNIRPSPEVTSQPPTPAQVNVSPPPGPPKQAKQFPPSVKKGKCFDFPDGIIGHLTRECGGNVHDRHVVDVTSGSFEKQTEGANPRSGHMIIVPIMP
jgi:polyhydroxyalkanoate synthesis regulator phasin